eukprot:13692409-Alexandrium_andersonii.AAC.1
MEVLGQRIMEVCKRAVLLLGLRLGGQMSLSVHVLVATVVVVASVLGLLKGGSRLGSRTMATSALLDLVMLRTLARCT